MESPIIADNTNKWTSPHFMAAIEFIHKTNLDFASLSNRYASQVLHKWLRRGELCDVDQRISIASRWFCNFFVQNGCAYLWRDNRRCSKRFFLRCLYRVLQEANCSFPFIGFHENLGMWRGRRFSAAARFLKIGSLDALMMVLAKGVRNMGKEFNGMRRSDNYNFVSSDGRVCLVISHENEMLLFSQDQALLGSCRSRFRKVGLSVHMVRKTI